MNEENRNLQNEEEINGADKELSDSLRGLYQDSDINPDEELPEEEEVEPIKEKPEPPKLTPEERKKKVLKEIKEWIVSIVVAIAAVLILKNFLFMPITVDGSSMSPTLADGDKLFVTVYDVNIVNKLEVGDVVICHYPGRTSKHSILKFLTVKTDFVKRIVAMEGDTVSRVSGVTYVNGVALDPRAKVSYSITYTKDEDGTFHIFYNGTELPIIKGDDGSVRYSTGGGYTATLEAIANRYKFDYTYTMGADEYFVVGDNRYNSHDSRTWDGPDLPFNETNNTSGDVGPITKDMITGHVRSIFWPFSNWSGVANDPDYMYPTDRTEN